MEDARAGDEPSVVWTSIRERVYVVDAARADAATRALALPPESAAWWWLAHVRDDEVDEHRVHRLRLGIELLVVHEPRRGDTRSRRASC